MSEATIDDLMQYSARRVEQLRRSVDDKAIDAAFTMICARRPGLGMLDALEQHFSLVRIEKEVDQVQKGSSSIVPTVAYSLLTGMHTDLLANHLEQTPKTLTQLLQTHYFAITTDYNAPRQFGVPAAGFHAKAREHARDAFALGPKTVDSGDSYAYKFVRFADVCFHLHKLDSIPGFTMLDKAMEYLVRTERKLPPGSPDAHQAAIIARSMCGWLEYNMKPDYAPYHAQVRRLAEKWQGFVARQVAMAQDKKAL